jgi:hypothetical protein
LSFSWARVLVEIAERDLQQFDSPGAAADHLERQEAAREASLARDVENESDARAGDMYRAYKMINGERTSLAYRAPDGCGSVRRIGPSRTPRRAYRPANAGAGAIFTGRGAVPRSKLNAIRG